MKAAQLLASPESHWKRSKLVKVGTVCGCNIN